VDTPLGSENLSHKQLEAGGILKGASYTLAQSFINKLSVSRPSPNCKLSFTSKLGG